MAFVSLIIINNSYNCHKNCPWPFLSFKFLSENFFIEFIWRIIGWKKKKKKKKKIRLKLNQILLYFSFYQKKNKKNFMLVCRVVCCLHQLDCHIRVFILHWSDCCIRVCILHQSYHSIWISCNRGCTQRMILTRNFGLICGLYENLINQGWDLSGCKS